MGNARESIKKDGVIMNRNFLKQQVEDCAGNVLYTYSAHWNMVNRYKKFNSTIKIASIILTAFSTGGILTSILSNVTTLSWLSALTSALALALNLSTLNFDLPNMIKDHTDAANELWDVRESYKSLLVDFDNLDIDTIKSQRDILQSRVSDINKSYKGTDTKSFEKAKKEINKYTFSDNESNSILHL